MDGIDLAAMAALGMDEKSLAKRRAMLEELSRRITAPIETTKPRAVLKEPQMLLLEVGELLIYPVCNGDPINPYAVGQGLGVGQSLATGWLGRLHGRGTGPCVRFPCLVSPLGDY